MINKVHQKVCLLLALLLFISGCGSTQSNNAENENITLLEPQGAVANYEVADYHNLYSTSTYPATVSPYMYKEYEMSDAIQFSHYLVSPNQQVVAGTPLLSGETKDLDEQIKTLEEQIADAETEHLAYVEEATDKLDEPRKNKKFYYGLTIEYKDREPEFTEWGTKYQDVSIEVKKMETELAHAIALYELDHNYKLSQLQKLKEQRQSRMLIADASGTIMGMKAFQYGDTVPSYTPIIAVGDPSRKEIKCDYISKVDISVAEDIYAFFDGKTYQVEYEPMSDQEYAKHAIRDEKVYSTFQLKEGLEELQLGDRGIIAIVHSSRENVLSVMKKSVQKDTDGYYVYVLQGEESVRVPVVTGVEDSIYIEILSGLSAGDKVLTNEVLKATSDTAQVTWGSLDLELESTANIYFPEYTIVKNPVKFADCYYKEALVSRYQPVKAGDVLATVRVTPANNDLQRKNQQLVRTQERLADLQTEYDKEDDIKIKKELQRSITKKQREITKLNLKIEELQKDFKVEEIKAPFDGIVIWISDYKNEEKILYDVPLFQIAAYENCFLQMEDERKNLQYGDQVTIKYEDLENNELTATGTVVTPGESCISAQITGGVVMIQLPDKVLENLCISTANSNGTWTQSSLKISVNRPLLKEVLVIPKKYVTMIKRQTYVKVVEEDGHVYYQSIVTGGIDRNNYAVIEGLTEGTVVCYE